MNKTELTILNFLALIAPAVGAKVFHSNNAVVAFNLGDELFNAAVMQANNAGTAAPPLPAPLAGALAQPISSVGSPLVAVQPVLVPVPVVPASLTTNAPIKLT